MAAPQWEQRERPVLEAIVGLEETGDDATNERVAEVTGLGVDVVGRTMKRLDDAHFIRAFEGGDLLGQHPVYFRAEMLERGLRSVGAWPPSVVDAFVQRLEVAVSNEADPEKRALLQRLASAAVDVSKGVLSGAIVAAGQAGMT